MHLSILCTTVVLVFDNKYLVRMQLHKIKHNDFISKQALQIFYIKAELLQEGILFGTQFPSLGIFISKKLDFEKLRPPSIQLLKLI